MLDLPYRAHLVGGFLKRESGFEFRLPFGVRRQGDSRLGLAKGLQLHHVARQVDDGGLGSVFFVLPAGAAVFRQLRVSATAADVFLHQIDLGHRHVDTDAVPKLQNKVFFSMLMPLNELHTAVASDPVTDVNHQVVFGQFQKAIDSPRFEPPSTRLDGPGLLPME